MFFGRNIMTMITEAAVYEGLVSKHRSMIWTADI